MRFPVDLNDPVARVMFAIMAGICLVALLRYLYLIFRSRGWRVTRGEISDFVYNPGSVNSKRPDRLRVKYRYKVGEEFYDGDKIGIREWMFPGVPGADFPARPSMIRKIKNRAQSNREITIHYDPKRPELSCIDPSPEKGLIVLIVFLLVSSVIFAIG